jgi:hypothetical protein
MILVIGVIVVFGTKAIIDLTKANCDVSRADFEKKLNNYINDYSDKGSVHTVSLKAPCNAKTLCFVDSTILNNPADADGLEVDGISDGVIVESVGVGRYNIFLKGEFTEGIGLSTKLTLDTINVGQILCLDASKGFVKIRFDGQGRTTMISQGAG